MLVDLAHFVCKTRPDIFYAVGMVSRFTSKPKWLHYQTALRIPRCVKGNPRHGILFSSRVLDDAELICYSDSDWCGDRVDRRSTT